MKLKIPPILQFLFYGILELLTSSFGSTFNINWLGISYLGWAIIGLGCLILSWAVVEFIKAKTTVNPIAPEQAQSLVTTGLYRISRNPMYLGMTLVLTGLALLLGNVLTLLIPIIFMGSITYTQIIPEEEILTQKFGREYLEYKRSTPRFIFCV